MVNSGELKRKQNNNRVIIHFGRLYKKATIECRIRLRIDQCTTDVTVLDISVKNFHYNHILHM